MTRRQTIANALVAIGVAAGLAWLFTEIFGRLGTTTDWGKAWNYREALWRGWVTTLGVSLASLVGSVVFGVLFLLGQRSSLPVVRWLCRGFLEFVRDTPLLVHLLFGYFVIFAPILSRPLSQAGINDKFLIGVLLLSVFSGVLIISTMRVR